MGITIENLQDMVKVTENLENLIERAAVLCLESEEIEQPCEIFFMLVDNGNIREMNREYRRIDSPTDVLSFPIVDMKEGKIESCAGDFDPVDNVMVLGDIVISLEMAEKQALEYGHALERELAFLAVHGVYHLLGYDHCNEAEEKNMIEKQEFILSKMGLQR